MTPTSPAVSALRLTWVVLFISAGVLGFEISLMRLLLVASWHHFAFLVISVALLGFGASGTALALLRRRIMPHHQGTVFGLTLATAVSMPLCCALAQQVCIEARILPALMWQQILSWVLYWAILGLPFFLGASVVGLALMVAREHVARIYAGNLLGSAAGLILATSAMHFIPPHWLPLLMSGTVLIAALGPARGSRKLWAFCVAGTIGGVAILSVLHPPGMRPDAYKFSAYVQRLCRQGLAHRSAVFYGPRAVVEAYRGAAFHNLPFLTAGATPPPVAVLLQDGHLAGSVLQVRDAAQAQVVEQTVMALPYAFLPADPNVLLLGETGGTNIWLAARHRAQRIDVVQGDENVFKVLQGPLHAHGGSVLAEHGVHAITAEPRHFVDHAARHYDLIQLASLESSAAGSGGVGGLGENHLACVEGLTACLQCLTPDGLLAVTRGVQDPPRDNLKLLATCVAALRRNGVSAPENHLLVVRDFLAVCTMVKASPWTTRQVQQVRWAYRDRNLTPVWFPGITPEELNKPDAFAAAPDGIGDWYHYAVRQLCSSAAEQFIRQWSFNIRPPTDDRPFFLDFCRLSSLAAFKRAYGDLWLTRTELGFVFVLAAIAIIAVIGFLLTLAPLLVLTDIRQARGRLATLVYFAAIGLAYLLLEMTLLSRLTNWIGDPISAAAVTITGFLFFSGLGSLTVGRRGVSKARTIRMVIVALLAISLIEHAALLRWAVLFGSWSYALRCAAALTVIAPLGYLMGFPMPAGLARLNAAGPALIPWAWGINGFASVLAAPLATAMGMTWGFTAAAAAALLLYAVAALIFTRLPK